ncbi:MAG: hypothetical protein G01um101430_315 [Parcubacteria group bacterium Gr01-1014_30]|nr:MAG: hypothetical protein G01um101430_315 [Parcubacteria group bacterium Gr01-1014_30]
MKHQLNVFKTELRERGLFYALKKAVLYLLRPITDLMKTSTFLVNLRYGVLPNLLSKITFHQDNLLLKLPQTDLVRAVRNFWYGSILDRFVLEGEEIKKEEIFTYGGPNPEFSCPICQKAEWVSRIRQENLFLDHSCPSSEKCRKLCEKQGNDLWTHFHQNFDFSLGCSADLPAPKGVYVLFGKLDMFHALRLEPMERIFHRQFAFACQLDIAEGPFGIDWKKYDFMFMYLPGAVPKFKRPPIPVILFAHDFWREPKASQWVLDWLEPEVFLTTYPTQFKENYRFPKNTKVVFHPMFTSNFFTRPNLSQKSIDLLSVGNTKGPLYQGRRNLNMQLQKFKEQYPSYKLEFSHIVGTLKPNEQEGLEYTDSQGNQIRYLNKWSEYLGTAKYVIFGKMKYPILVGKYYETLGSGAIPIFPEVPDLKLLGVKPFEHYIPLAEIEGNSERLKYFLDNYEKFKYIGKNAVKWYKDNSDKMLFAGFEGSIREVTNYKFPKRLVR